MAVLVLALVGASIVIGVVVSLTPLEDPDDALAASAKTALTDSSVADSSPGGATRPSRDVSPEELDLPVTAESIDVAELRSELGALAELLERDYDQNAAALHIAAQIYAELKQTTQARSAWQACVDLKPQLAGPYAGLSELQIANGQEEEAIELLQQAHTANIRSSETLANLAAAYENLGELPQAQELLQQATTEYPQEGDLWQALGRVQNQMREYAAAEESLQRALELKGPSEAVLFTLITALVRQSKADEAKQYQEQLAQLRAARTKAAAEVAAQETAGDSQPPDAAFQAGYEQALAGIAQRVFLAASSVAEQQTDFEEAERLARRTLSLNPDQLQGYMALISALRNQRRLPEALAVHKLLLQKQPDNIFNYTNQASLALQLGDTQLARQTLEQAAEVDPNNALVQISLAKVYLTIGEFREARLLAASIVAEHPSAESYLLLAATYDAVGDQSSAQAAVRKAKQQWPDHPLFQSSEPTFQPGPPLR